MTDDENEGIITISESNVISSIATNSTTNTTFTVEVAPNRTTPFRNIAFNLSLAYGNTIVNYPFTLQFENHAAPGTIGICEQEEMFQFSMSPNPTEEFVNISSEESLKEYEITDLNGKIIRKGTINGNQTTLNIDKFAAGIYLVKITTASDKTAVQKIVKK